LEHMLVLPQFRPLIGLLTSLDDRNSIFHSKAD
jgi:hypothetical protein